MTALPKLHPNVFSPKRTKGPFGDGGRKPGQFVKLYQNPRYWCVEVDTLYLTKTPKSYDVSSEGTQWASQIALDLGCDKAFGFYRSRYRKTASSFKKRILAYYWSTVGYWEFKDKAQAIHLANQLVEGLCNYIPEYLAEQDT